MRQNWINKFEIAGLLGLVLATITSNIAVFGQECDTLRQDVVRLHILANSDSETDQAVKLQVRDRILEEVGAVFEQPTTQAQAKAEATRLLPQIERIAAQTLQENGYDLPIHAEIGKMYFTTRDYGNYALPAGVYDAVRVTLGAGKGHNWWCVMYPPICVPAATPGDSPALTELENLNEEPLFKPKLAVVELFETIKSSWFSEPKQADDLPATPLPESSSTASQ